MTRAAFGFAAGVAAFAAAAILAFARGGAGSAPLPLASLSTLGTIRPAPAQGPVGPEGVPVPAGPQLAPPRAPAAGQSVDGIVCESSEQVLSHVHAHLSIVVRGEPRRVPAGIGIGVPRRTQQTAAGEFVTAGSCFAWLHTHAADGVVHAESPVDRAFTLGELFDVWGQRLDRTHVGPAQGRVTALLDDRVFTGDPRRIPVTAHAEIQLEVGSPLVAPEEVRFPDGL